VTEVFATTWDDKVRVSAQRLGASKGDRFELVGAERLTRAEFEECFNKHLSPEMRNVELTVEPSPTIKIDETSLSLKDLNLRTHASDAVLRSRLEPAKGDLTVYADGRSIPQRNSHLYLWYSSLERKSWVTFTSGKHQFTPDRLKIQTDSLEIPPAVDRKVLQESVRLYSSEGIEGKFKFRMDRDMVYCINNRLVWAAREDRFTHERGSIAEDLSVCALEAGGWTEIKRHPLADRPDSHSASMHGPDSLMEWNQTSEESFHEIKWWDDARTAWSYALTQVAKARQTWIPDAGQRVDGAFIDILDMKRLSSEGVLHVKRVW